MIWFAFNWFGLLFLVDFVERRYFEFLGLFIGLSI